MSNQDAQQAYMCFSKIQKKATESDNEEKTILYEGLGYLASALYEIESTLVQMQQQLRNLEAKP